jgi:hypothetical protein
MTGLWKRVAWMQVKRLSGPSSRGAHSKKTYSELIEAYLGRTDWMRVTVGNLLDSGSDRGIFSCSSPTRFNEQEVYLLLYSVLTGRKRK